MADTAPDKIAALVDLSLERGRRRGDYHGPVTENEDHTPPPMLRPAPAPVEPMTMPELRPGLLGLLADAAVALAHLIRKD